MFRIATLCQTCPSVSQRAPAVIEPVGLLFDILCCQISRKKEAHDPHGYLRTLASSLQMTCSATLLVPCRQRRQSANVLSILTGPGVWVLNSGSIAVPVSATEQQRVQFALVRKGSAAVLIINLHYDAPRRERLALLRAAFNHQIVREQRYSAMILCAERRLRLSRSEADQLMAGTDFILHRNLKPEQDGTGAMMLCVPRRQGQGAQVELGKQGSCRLASSCPDRMVDTTVQALLCEFQVQSEPGIARKKPHYPLSFAEQWAGYKEYFRPSAP